MPKNNDGSNGAKKLLTKAGIVTSDKMQKTIVVRIDTVTRHPLYKKV
ncbi:MAG: 30S ribosomal protein S17, partial [Candidatus Omnitrophota bacterium]|nr:30S ribosomal protein S17 [Candidatus Omnitrophota bacterium]